MNALTPSKRVHNLGFRDVALVWLALAAATLISGRGPYTLRGRSAVVVIVVSIGALGAATSVRELGGLTDAPDPWRRTRKPRPKATNLRSVVSVLVSLSGGEHKSKPLGNDNGFAPEVIKLFRNQSVRSAQIACSMGLVVERPTNAAPNAGIRVPDVVAAPGHSGP